MLNASYRKEDSDSRGRVSSNVSSLREGIITQAEAESLKGVGLFCSLSSGWVRSTTSPLLCRQLHPSNHLHHTMPGTHAGLASAWGWG